jgi:uncharacterized protein (DUF2267 family)
VAAFSAFGAIVATFVRETRPPTLEAPPRIPILYRLFHPSVRLPEMIFFCIGVGWAAIATFLSPYARDIGLSNSDVAAALQVDRTQAEQAIRGVLVALLKTVGPDEFADLRSELPRDFGPWLDRAIVDGGGEPNADQGPSADGRPVPEPGMCYQQFLQAVAARGAHDDERARMAAEAVLEVLATRVTGGQLDDLEPLLPRELCPALERGRARSGGRARPLTLQECLREVQEREGVTRDIALRHARAVMLTLREALGGRSSTTPWRSCPSSIGSCCAPTDCRSSRAG